MADLSSRCLQLKNLPAEVTETIVQDCLDHAGFSGWYLELHRHVERDEDTQDVRWLVLFETNEGAQKCRNHGDWKVETSAGSLHVHADYCSECVIPRKWIDATAEDWTMVDSDAEDGEIATTIHRNRLESFDSEELFASGGKDLDDTEETPEIRKGAGPHELKTGLDTEQSKHSYGSFGLDDGKIKGELGQNDDAINSVDLFGSGSRNSSENLSIQSHQLFGDGENEIKHDGNVTKPVIEADKSSYKTQDEKNDGYEVPISKQVEKTKTELGTPEDEGSASKMDADPSFSGVPGSVSQTCAAEFVNQSGVTVQSGSRPPVVTQSGIAGFVDQSGVTVQSASRPPVVTKSGVAGFVNQSGETVQSASRPPVITQSCVAGFVDQSGETVQSASRPAVVTHSGEAGHEQAKMTGRDAGTKGVTSSEIESPVESWGTPENLMQHMNQGMANPSYIGLPYMYGGFPPQNLTNQSSPVQNPGSPLYQQQMQFMMQQQFFIQQQAMMQQHGLGAGNQPLFFAPMTFDAEGNPVPLMPIGNQQQMAAGNHMSYMAMGNQKTEFAQYDYATPMLKPSVKGEGGKSMKRQEDKESTYMYMSRFPKSDTPESVEQNSLYDKIGDIERSLLVEVPPLPPRDFEKALPSKKSKEKRYRKISQSEDVTDSKGVPEPDSEPDYTTIVKDKNVMIFSDDGRENDEYSSLKIRESTEVTDLDQDDDASGGSCKIKVTGILRSISKETLELFFENEKRSGGGDVHSVYMKDGKEEAIIEFKDPRVVSRILQRQESGELRVSDISLNVTVHDPQIDRRKVFVSGLSEATTKQSLENYFEAKCGSVPTDVRYGETPGTALVSFASQPDFQALQTACKNQALETNYLEVSEVEVTRSVKVTGCRMKESTDGILYYFENRRRSQGGDVETVEFLERTGAYIVTFCNVEDAERVCEQELHTLNQTEISVCLYYPEMELDSSLIFTIPDPIELTEMDTFLKKFLLNNKVYHAAVDEKISACHGCVQWPKSTDQNLVITCTVNKKDVHGGDKVQNWTQNCRAEMTLICDKIKVEDSLQIAKEAWDEFKAELAGVHVQEPDKMALFLQVEKAGVVIVGEERVINDVVNRVRLLIVQLEQRLEQQQQTITKVYKVKRYEIILLLATKFHEKFRRSSVNVQMSHENAEVTFMGLKKDVDMAIDKMVQTIRSFPKRTIKSLRREAHGLLYKTETRAYIKKQLSIKHVIGIWDVNKAGELELYSQNESDLDKAVEVLKKCLREKTVNVSSKSATIIHSKEWDDCIDKLEKTNSGLFKVDVKQLEVYIVGMDNIIDEIEMEIEKLFDLHKIVEEFLSVDPGKFRFISRCKTQDLQNIKTQYARLKVDIERVDRRHKKGFQIKGEKSGCQMTVRKIKELLDTVEIKDHCLTHPHAKEFLHSQDGTEALSEIEKSSQCVFEFATTDVQRKHTVSKPVVMAQCRVGPCTIAVTVGDLTNTEVDCLVIPTDGRLSNMTGLSAAVKDKGGDTIQAECEKEKKVLGRNLSAGHILSTTAGSLPCKALIHAILPEYTDGVSEEFTLKRIITSCLDAADRKKFRSVIFPLLGFGKHKFPLQKATKWLLECLFEKIQGVGKVRNLEKIYICDMRQEIADKVILVMKTVMATKGYNVENKGTLGRRSVSKFEEVENDDDDDDGNNDDGNYSEGAVGGAMPHKAGIKVKVVVGELAKMKVDVIVNSTNPGLNLSMGNVSKALYGGGGEGLQMECRQKYPKGIILGQLAVTSGGLLGCNYIFHGLLVAWDYGGGNSEKVLKNFVTRCLEEADQMRLGSIAFPALGTGNLQYPVGLVAQLMFDTVNEYQVDNPGTSIQHVDLVVWSGDAEAIKAFQQVEEREKQYKHLSAKLPAKPTEDTFAEHRLRTNKKMIKVFDGMKVEIDQGDITQEKSDVIVNSIQHDLDLNTGRVSKAILEAAGQIIQTECKAAGNTTASRTKGLVETSAGRLTYCKKIYHVESKTTETDWTRVILMCLQRADSSGFASISFPAMGTGGKGCSPESMSRAMFEAFRQFSHSSSYTRTLKHVRIVIFQQEMMRKFIEGAAGIQKKRLTSFLPGGKKKTKTEDSVTLYIYGGSYSAVRTAIQQLDGLLTEETCFFSKAFIQKWQAEKKSKLDDYWIKYWVEVKIDASKNCIFLRGYSKKVKIFKRELEKQERESSQGQYQSASRQTDSDQRAPIAPQVLYPSDILPNAWKLMSPQSRIEVVKISSKDPEYQVVYSRFMSETYHTYSVIEINRIQNKDLYRMYAYKKQTMRSGTAQYSQERQLWYPTSELEVIHINRQGFDVTRRIDMGLGKGVNFDVIVSQSVLARCARDMYGHLHIYLANVMEVKVALHS